jgi:hypothetical protein
MSKWTGRDTVCRLPQENTPHAKVTGSPCPSLSTWRNESNSELIRQQKCPMSGRVSR